MSVKLGVFDSSLDRSDRKISAPATLETPRHRTNILGHHSKQSTPIQEGILQITPTTDDFERLIDNQSPVSSVPSKQMKITFSLGIPSVKYLCFFEGSEQNRRQKGKAPPPPPIGSMAVSLSKLSKSNSSMIDDYEEFAAPVRKNDERPKSMVEKSKSRPRSRERSHKNKESVRPKSAVESADSYLPKEVYCMEEILKEQGNILLLYVELTRKDFSN